jgi:hypothetical protein
MKGWVYIISNKAMSGILKIGYSTKDPKLRAAELNHTGSPYPYVVEYEMLIEEPYQIEQRIHKVLSSCKEGKEWFRCSIKEAITAIKKIVASSFIYEQTRKALPEEQLTPTLKTLKVFGQVVGRCPQCSGDVALKAAGPYEYLKCLKCKQVFSCEALTKVNTVESASEAKAKNNAMMKAQPITTPLWRPIRPVDGRCPHCSSSLVIKKIGIVEYEKCETCAIVFPKADST